MKDSIKYVLSQKSVSKIVEKAFLRLRSQFAIAEYLWSKLIFFSKEFFFLFKINFKINKYKKIGEEKKIKEDQQNKSKKNNRKRQAISSRESLIIIWNKLEKISIFFLLLLVVVVVVVVVANSFSNICFENENKKRD